MQEQPVRTSWFKPGLSLRWRLALSISGLIAALVLAFLAAGYFTVEQGLVNAGGQRAQAAAAELAGRFTTLIRNVLSESATEAKKPVLGALLRSPSDANRTAVQAVLLPPGEGLRRVELWHRDGRLLFEGKTDRSAGATPRLLSYPRGIPPIAAGVSPLQAAGEFPYFSFTLEVPDPATPSAPPLGYLRRFGELTATGPIRRLLGAEAEIKIGSADGVWSDLAKVAVAPPPLEAGSEEYSTADGRPWIGAFARVEGTPWSVLVAYPRHHMTTVAPVFLIRMTTVALVIVGVGIMLALHLGGRITKPLTEINGAISRVAAGDYSTRVRARTRDEIGELAHGFNTMAGQLGHDIAARLKAEAEVRERETSFRHLFANNPLPMWVYEPESLRFLEVNDAATSHYGYTREEFLGMRITDIRPEADRVRLMEQVKAERRSLQRTLGWRHALKSGKIIEVEIISHTLTYDGQPAVLVVAQDITERKQLEAQFLQAQKMEALGQLTGGVAHDFNNVLTGILGYSTLVLDSLPDGDPRRADIDEIGKAARSAAALTAGLLAFSRKQLIEPRVLNLNAEVGETTRLLQRVVGEDVSLDLHLAPDLGNVRADPGQIQQVLMNLVVNARDAMPKGGRLTIETANAELDEEFARTHPETLAGPYVMLAVSDTGVGMSEDVRRRIFEPFFTTKEAGQGTGLGLATVYGIVKQSGGGIWIYSEPDLGTSVKVYLPRVRAAVAPVQPAASSKAPERRATILVAEDNPALSTLVRRILEKRGHRVLVANSATEALRVAQADAGPIDLLLSDVVMPDVSGPALVLEFLKIQPEARILHMSGYTDDAVVRHGVISGATAFIQKPFTPAALIAKINAVLSDD